MAADIRSTPGRGIPQAQVHDVYKNLLDSLKTQAWDDFAATLGAPRTWFMPTGFEGDLLDIPNLHKDAFDRNALNTNYEKVMSDSTRAGTTADAIALKRQIDYVAAAERAWRLRHASVPRLLAHSAGRSYGQGRGLLFDAIRENVENILKAGGVP